MYAKLFNGYANNAFQDQNFQFCEQTFVQTTHQISHENDAVWQDMCLK